MTLHIQIAHTKWNNIVRQFQAVEQNLLKLIRAREATPAQLMEGHRIYKDLHGDLVKMQALLISVHPPGPQTRHLWSMQRLNGDRS